MEKLTNKQNAVLDFLKKSIANDGFPPTVREICKGIGLSSPATVQVHLNTLEEKGYIKRGDSKNRAIELLVENEYEEKEIIDVPLLGKVTAGSPIEAIEMPDEYFSLPAYLIPPKKEVTLKTFYKEDGYFRLQPENDTMDPIILDKVYIIGKAIGLYRKI